jgi:hypothetical protein
MKLHIGEKVFDVADLADASARFCQFRGSKGASQLPSGIVYKDGEEVARVSYNGKVWPPGALLLGREPLYEPGADRPGVCDFDHRTRMNLLNEGYQILGGDAESGYQVDKLGATHTLSRDQLLEIVR